MEDEKVPEPDEKYKMKILEALIEEEWKKLYTPYNKIIEEITIHERKDCRRCQIDSGKYCAGI